MPATERSDANWLKLLVPEVFFEDDADGEYGRLLAVLFGMVQELEADLDAFPATISPASAPEEWLPYLADELGWRLDPNLEVRIKRRLIQALVPIVYALKATDPGIEQTLELVFRLPATVTPLYTISEGWQLGRSHLGDTTELLPQQGTWGWALGDAAWSDLGVSTRMAHDGRLRWRAADPAIYTFEVRVQGMTFVPDTANMDLLAAIVDTVKAGHTHWRLKQDAVGSNLFIYAGAIVTRGTPYVPQGPMVNRR